MKIKYPTNLFYTGILITCAATAANLMIFGIAHLLGEKFIIPISENSSVKEPMPIILFVIATIISSVLAVIFFAFLEKFSAKSVMPPFLSVSITALIVSLGGPFSIPETGLQTKLILVSMHFVAFIIIVGGLVGFHRNKFPNFNF
jgi:H+/Cl- antiporter ClcA